jgi:hypothetical protein
LNSRASDTELRNFGLVVGGLSAALFGLVAPWLRHRPWPLWPWILATALVISGLLTPYLLYYPQLVWSRVGKLLGWINSRIVLNLLFFLLFVPAGLLARCFKWDPLKRNFEHARQSYRIPSKRRPVTTMEKPY